MKVTKFSSIAVLLRIALIVLCVEFVVTELFQYFDSNPRTLIRSALDSIITVLLSTPIIYVWIIKPFVEERDHLLEKFKQMALRDPLTNLANRRLLKERLTDAISSYGRHKSCGAIVFIDLDDFKPINDKYGHEAGDQLLKTVAERLESNIRAHDLACRVGGDEFVLLVQLIDPNIEKATKKIKNIAEKVVESLQRPIIYDDEKMFIGASIGIKLLKDVCETPASIIEDADLAMYQSKKLQKGGIKFYES